MIFDHVLPYAFFEKNCWVKKIEASADLTFSSIF